MAKPPKTPKARAGKSRRRDLSKTALGETPEKRGIKKPVSLSAEQEAARELSTKVKTARGRKLSSTRWLQRQLNDPYVVRAKAEGYRSRAAYKLIELDDKFGFLKPGGRVVDLGAAPGGWCQVAVKRTEGRGRVVGIDYLGMPPVDGADVLELDFLDDTAPGRLKDLLGGEADVVMSDMAAPTTGHRATDHLRIIALAEEALSFAEEVLSPGGTYLAKVFQGGSEKSLLDRLKADFRTVAHAKPAASRADSAEMYVVATGFKGRMNERETE
ncbi:RlmE family RNA methyltransferase [Parvularcula dongshanensis]|uniref:Ribosomal RNA large subunit methyltransferase E n=1 Tax=Parvularcula dongshanensis TaxID=1173995 RepID=A0A840HZZ3_9PROT|nr:RlmE family RNA methyltransferase [Parvularcula dongshanensis]MBB4657593.1 23S rRNA (uridine2552-2'-O)-methyltransferase [Parvularcula dongshanensis]